MQAPPKDAPPLQCFGNPAPLFFPRALSRAPLRVGSVLTRAPVLSPTGLDCYQGTRFELSPGFKVAKPSLVKVSDDGSTLFVASEDERTAHTFECVSGKGA